MRPTYYHKVDFKYRLSRNRYFDTGILGYDVSMPFIKLRSDGFMVAYLGFCWDGPSGPTVDTPDWMGPSLFHDAIYRLIRNKLLPLCIKKSGDYKMRERCRQKGMHQLRAWYSFVAVKYFGNSSADPELSAVVEHVAP